MQQRHVLVRRDYVYVIGLDRDAIVRLLDGHRRAALQQLDQHALLRWIQVLHDDESYPAGFRHTAQECFQRLEATGRRTDTDDSKALTSRRQLRFGGAGRSGFWVFELPLLESRGFRDLASARGDAGAGIRARPRRARSLRSVRRGPRGATCAGFFLAVPRAIATTPAALFFFDATASRASGLRALD